MEILIDAHCHFSVFPNNQNMGYICNSVTESDWEPILNLAKQNKNIFPCIGIHPWYIDTASENWDTKLCNLLNNFPNIMIGECGIDKTHQSFDDQIQIFARHIQIASQFNRPIHIHCVHAWNEMFNILKNIKNLPTIVLHGFGGSPETLMQFAKFTNVYFSFGPSILDLTRTKIQHALQIAPKNRILIESDAEIKDSQNVLMTIFNQIIKYIEIDKTQIYNNAMGILKNGQITQNTNAVWG